MMKQISAILFAAAAIHASIASADDHGWVYATAVNRTVTHDGVPPPSSWIKIKTRITGVRKTDHDGLQKAVVTISTKDLDIPASFWFQQDADQLISDVQHGLSVNVDSCEDYHQDSSYRDDAGALGHYERGHITFNCESRVGGKPGTLQLDFDKTDGSQYTEQSFAPGLDIIQFVDLIGPKS